MLRGFSPNFGRAVHALRQRGHQLLHVAIAAHGTEAATGFGQGRADPAEHHVAVAPALDVARVMRDQAIQILDRVGGSQRAIQRLVEAECDQRERLIETFA